MRRAVPLLLLALVLASASACGGKKKGPAPPPPPRTTVRVENHKFLDVTVYVLRGGQRIRLGMVPGSNTRVFTIPPQLIFGMASLRFMIDPIGSDERPVSHEFVVRAGDEIFLLIPA